MSSNDTVAAVGLVKEKSFPRLNSIIFGEGIVNDAVIIIMFRLINKEGVFIGI